MDQFSSAEDIQSFIEDHLTDRVAADAIAAVGEIQTLAQGWCDSGCTSKTAKFLRGIFGHMNGGQCTDASVFCGYCQERATSFFARNSLPCCVEEVVQRSIQVKPTKVSSTSNGFAKLVILLISFFSRFQSILGEILRIRLQ